MDVVIIGAGIVGLAHAFAAIKRGHRVTVVERHARAIGASIRNFGMIWPVGQPAGPDRDRALRSREIWLELSQEVGFWCEPCGSLHVAHANDEWDVLKEFHEGEGAELGLELLTPEAARERCPALRPDRLHGGLYSPRELAVDPREAVSSIAAWLETQQGVEIRWGDPVARIEGTTAWSSSGLRWEADRVFICTGADFELLFPEAYRRAPLTRCKLQMMRTAPQPGEWRLGMHVAGGLTLRHYASFAQCPSLDRVRQRVSRENPDYDRWGIHVMAAQNGCGELIIGDSHEYGEAPYPFDADAIDALIWNYFDAMIEAPSPAPAARWNGVYLKRTDGESALVADPAPGVRIVNALGGAGMTLSMGLADEQLASV